MKILRICRWSFGILFFAFGAVGAANTQTMLAVQAELRGTHIIAASDNPYEILLTMPIRDLSKIKI